MVVVVVVTWCGCDVMVAECGGIAVWWKCGCGDGVVLWLWWCGDGGVEE